MTARQRIAGLAARSLHFDCANLVRFNGAAWQSAQAGRCALPFCCAIRTATPGVRVAVHGDMLDKSQLGTRLAHADLTARIIDGFFTAFGELGHGFSEAVLRKGFAIVLSEAGLDVMEEYPLNVQFRGRCIGKFYADIIVNRTVLVEVKGSREIEPFAQAQLLNYLKVAGGGVGLLMNFGRKPEFKRLVVGDPDHSLPTLGKL